MSGGSNRTSPTLPMASSPEEADFDHTKCTAARAKSVIKTIFAQLFSHLGLCLLVIGYSVMGAVIFVSLEAPNETKTRQDVSRMKNLTLNQLYDLTGKKITLFCLTWVEVFLIKILKNVSFLFIWLKKVQFWIFKKIFENQIKRVAVTQMQMTSVISSVKAKMKSMITNSRLDYVKAELT